MEARMTPEETIAHLTTVLSNIAAIDDGNINALLKANQVADQGLRALRPRKQITITITGRVDPDTTAEDINIQWLEDHRVAQEHPLIWSVDIQ
jgi:hypothetical protein